MAPKSGKSFTQSRSPKTSVSVLNLAQLLSTQVTEFYDIDPEIYADWYLHSCYPKVPFHDEKLILDFLVRERKKLKNLDSLLDIGCGPVVSHALVFAPLVRQILMSDFLGENLQQIDDWAETNGTSDHWNLHTAHILKREGIIPTQQLIAERESILREKMLPSKVGDLRHVHPIKEDKKFSIVMCIYASEQAARDQGEWHRVVSNLSNMVEAGGHLFLVCVRDSKFYAIHDEMKNPVRIPIVNVTKEMMKEAVAANGFSSDAVIESKSVKGLGEEALDGVLMMHAMKPVH